MTCTVLQDLVSGWLRSFSEALDTRAAARLATLFVADSHWRDLLALTWDLAPVSGAEAIGGQIAHRAAERHARGFRLDAHRTPPRVVRRGGVEVIEAFFEFETSDGQAEGIVRIPADEAEERPRAWVLLTALKELTGHEGSLRGRRHPGIGFDRARAKENWLDRRIHNARFDDREPEVLIVGGGHNGLMLAARLRQLQVDALVVDRHPRIGDNWRRRYQSLALHNQTDAVQFPYLKYPDTFPSYLPKDRLANWLENYVDALEIDYWPAATFTGGDYDEATGRWTVAVERAGLGRRVLRPRHVVLATGGVGGTPRIPQLAGLDTFASEVVHSSRFGSGNNYRTQRVLVVGAGTSAHDVALDLHTNGARVTMLQRNPTVVINLKSADLTFSQYVDGTPLDEADLIGAANFVYPVLRAGLRELTEQTSVLDEATLTALRRAGMRVDGGEDETGWLMKFFRHGGGYYINVGCSEVIAAGGIEIIQTADVDRFTPAGLLLTSGAERRFDRIVLATGYLDQESEVRRYFGDAVADRVGKVLGFDDRMEIRNAWRRTPQPGLWFQVGGLPQGRTYSKFLALQLRAALDGRLPGRHWAPGRDWSPPRSA